MKQYAKLDLADTILDWLWVNDRVSWPDTYQIRCQFLRDNSQYNTEPWNVWKAYDLLRATGRIELNYPNGKKGGHVVSFEPVTPPGFYARGS